MPFGEDMSVAVSSARDVFAGVVPIDFGGLGLSRPGRVLPVTGGGRFYVGGSVR
jgi:hypothetical protein